MLYDDEIIGKMLIIYKGKRVTNFKEKLHYNVLQKSRNIVSNQTHVEVYWHVYDILLYKLYDDVSEKLTAVIQEEFNEKS